MSSFDLTQNLGAVLDAMRASLEKEHDPMAVLLKPTAERPAPVWGAAATEAALFLVGRFVFQYESIMPGLFTGMVTPDVIAQKPWKSWGSFFTMGPEGWPQPNALGIKVLSAVSAGTASPLMVGEVLSVVPTQQVEPLLSVQPKDAPPSVMMELMSLDTQRLKLFEGLFSKPGLVARKLLRDNLKKRYALVGGGPTIDAPEDEGDSSWLWWGAGLIAVAAAATMYWVEKNKTAS